MALHGASRPRGGVLYLPAVDDLALSRRDFLERTAYAAGLAGMATLPPGVLLAEADKAQARRNPLPSPRNIEIDHVVVLMMENRSFDHYFGWLSGEADGLQDQTFPDERGREVATRHFKTLGSGGVEWKGCGHPDPGHGWGSGRAQLRGGFLARGSGNDVFALTYFDRGELPFIHPVSKEYTLYDRYFCSILASTYVNRHHMWGAQSGGTKENDYPTRTPGFQWETIFDRALSRGLTVRYYNSDLPFAALYGPRAAQWTSPISRYYSDCAAGTLPEIAFVDPPYVNGGGGDGLSADEHPLGDVRLGQAFMADVVNAFVRSPNYRRGVLFIVYDEWGGFFDHVRPPRVVDDRSSRDLNEDFGQMGFRIPAVAVSPYSRNRGSRYRVNHGIYGHESILKFISYRFGIGHLNKRHRYARNIGRSLDWERKPDFDPPALPDPPQVATTNCGSGGGDVAVQDSEQAHANDLAQLEELAYRFGVPVYEPKPEVLFRQPDSVVRAIRAERARRRRRRR
jgi:phospholipase C